MFSTCLTCISVISLSAINAYLYAGYYVTVAEGATDGEHTQQRSRRDWSVISDRLVLLGARQESSRLRPAGLRGNHRTRAGPWQR